MNESLDSFITELSKVSDLDNFFFLLGIFNLYLIIKAQTHKRIFIRLSNIR